MKKATFVPASGECRIVELSDDYDVSASQIRELVGGWFDCVRVDELGIVIYVHDEGIILNMEPNVTASTLGNRVLVGDVVICGSLSSRGIYDGETYDVPEVFGDETFLIRSQLANTLDELKRELSELAQEVLASSGQFTIMSEEDFQQAIAEAKEPAPFKHGDPMFN